jgi:cathepsin L
MKLILLLAVVVGSALAVDLGTQFELYKLEFGKSYETPEENEMRFKIFSRNVREIREHNARYEAGLETFEMGVNQFSDMTLTEYKQFLGLGVRGQPKAGWTRCGPKFNATGSLPASVDWRTKGYVTPIKNQKQCGSCWAFSSTGSLEGQHFKQTGKLVSLSEQNLVDCVKKDFGCDGGLMPDAFAYIKQNKGVDTEISYPYHARDQKCQFNSSNVGATDMGCVDIGVKNETSLTYAIAEVGPISVAINAAVGQFMHYKKGILKIQHCPGNQGDLDHGVLAVGYGSMNGTDYYIVKNSWGTSWGMQGWVLMARNFNNMCGISTYASYPTV